MSNSPSEESSEQNNDNSSENCDSVGFNLIKHSKKFREKKEKENKKLLGKKLQRPGNEIETNMIYLSKEKKIINSFIPNIDELNEFLQKCTIKEINKEDINEEINKVPKEKIFDPDEFIRKNYNQGKNNISFEDLGFELDKNSNEENQKLEDINKERNFNKILQEKNLDKQKKEIYDILNKIKQMKIEDIKVKDINKLNIVFDLDNTCIYSVFIYPNDIVKIMEKFPENDFKIIKFEYNGKYIYSAFVIRKGLKEFLEYTQKFCNFYINTLGIENYGQKIKDILEKIFKIKFKGFKGRTNNSIRNKFLYDLSLEQKNTIIFDDKIIAWSKDNGNVIISKLFIDKKIILDKLKNIKLEKNISLFLIDYSPFVFYQSSKNDWLNQTLKIEKMCPFYDFNNKNCYSGEYLGSEQYQFIYMKEIIKMIYYLINNYNIYVPDALKIIRYNIFYNCCFNLSFYKQQQKQKEIDILKDIIKNCGGIICDKKNDDEYYNMKYYFVCTNEDYKKNIEEINKQKIGKKNSKVISDEFIINSFFFMTNLENDDNNEKYYLDSNDKDDFDNY